MLSTHLHPLPLHRGRGPDRTEAQARQRREAWERANRRGLLLVHGFVGLFAGLLILFTGSATAFDAFGDWVRPVTGGLAFLGGALLVSGLARRPRSVGSMALEVGGLALMALWDLTMIGGFVVSAARSDELVVAWPWQDDVALPAARLYPIALYVGLFLMMCVHLWTVRRLDALEGTPSAASDRPAPGVVTDGRARSPRPPRGTAVPRTTTR